VGASEVAALFDASPYVSRFALWQVKAGRVPPPEITHERAAWGLRLEDAIAHAAAEREGWTIERAGHRVHPRVAGMGATLDFIVTGDDPGALEVKNVDWLAHRRGWDGDEPPPHILLQLQAQLAVTGFRWGCVAALVGGNDLRLYRYEARPKLIAEIERRVAAFWQSIRENRPPPVDGSDSTADALRALHPETRDVMLDLRESNRAPEVCAALLEATERRKAAEKEEAALKHELLAMLGDARAAMVFGFSVRVAVTPAMPDRVITPEMVGQVIKGRAESRRLTVKLYEPKGEAA
jgi:predicted phage-related endonuclease